MLYMRLSIPYWSFLRMTKSGITPMSVRELVIQGRPVRVRPLAAEAGVSAAALYNLIKEKKIEAIRIGRSVVVPPHAARPLLGIAEPLPQAA